MEIFGIRPVDAGSGSTDVLQDEDARRKLIVGTGALLALLLTLFYTILYVSQR